MPIFEVEEDNKLYEVEAPDLQTAISAITSIGQPQQQQPAEPKNYSWSEVPGEALSNLPSSFGNMVSATAQAVTSPVETIKGLYDLGLTGIGKFYADRYGSADGFKRALAEDPAGVLADASMFISGGAGTAARIPSMAGRAVQTARAVGKWSDPIYASARGAGQLAKGGGKLASLFLSGASSTPSKAIDVAAKAGYESAYQGAGRVANRVAGTNFQTTTGPGKFRQHMTGKGDYGDEIQAVESGLDNFVNEAKTKYQGDMQPIWNDRAWMDTSPIIAELEATGPGSAREMAYYGDKPRGGAKAYEEIDSLVRDWVAPPAKLNQLLHNLSAPAESIVGRKAVEDVGGMPGITSFEYLGLHGNKYRTPAGLDELRKQVKKVEEGYLRPGFGNNPNPQAAAVAAKMHNAIARQIASRWPDFPEVQGKMAEAFETVSEIRRTLGTDSGATIDSQIRKLHSILRDTAFTNYGLRDQLLNILIDNGAKDVREMISGDLLRGIQPRGFWQARVGGTIGGAAWFGFLANPATWAIVAAHSPRIAGETAYAAGKFAGTVIKPAIAVDRALSKYGITAQRMGRTAFQAGRLDEAQNNVEQLRQDIINASQQMGYNLHERVVNKIVSELTSEDPAIYLRGIKKVGKNKRLMKVIEAMAKGEE